MFVIDRVEFVEFDQFEQARELECQRTVRLQQKFKTLDEIIEVRNLSKDVVTSDQIRRFAFGDEFLGQLSAKEAVEGRHTLFFRDLSHVRGWFYPQSGNPLVHKILQ